MSKMNIESSGSAVLYKKIIVGIELSTGTLQLYPT